MAIAIRIPRMMMTTRSSMRVKPSSPSRRLRRLFSIRVLLSRMRRWVGGSKTGLGRDGGGGFAGPPVQRSTFGGGGGFRGGAGEEGWGRGRLLGRVGNDPRRGEGGQAPRRMSAPGPFLKNV